METVTDIKTNGQIVSKIFGKTKKRMSITKEKKAIISLIITQIAFFLCWSPVIIGLLLVSSFLLSLKSDG